MELFFSDKILKDEKSVISLCQDFSFQYAVHAPNDSYDPQKLAKVVEAIKAKIVVFHNIYWENEWEGFFENFRGIETTLCIENTYSVHEPTKFTRRYGIKRCLDLEHLQMECFGVYEKEFLSAIKQSAHIHLTGYMPGSQMWHTHIHHSPYYNMYILGLIKKAGYSGFIISEARTEFQTLTEFKKLKSYIKKVLY